MQQAIEECTRCQAICRQTLGHCLELGGKHADPAHTRLMIDCAEICQTSANFMLRGSDLHHRTCAVCTEVCRPCAEDCERVASGEQMIKAGLRSGDPRMDEMHYRRLLLMAVLSFASMYGLMYAMVNTFVNAHHGGQSGRARRVLDMHQTADCDYG
jgi:hypothetical protein